MPAESSPIFLDALRMKPTPRTPVWFMRQAGRALPAYRALREKHEMLEITLTPELATQVALMPVHELGVDAAILFADIMIPLISMGVDLKIVDSVGPVIASPVRTAADVRGLGAPDHSGATASVCTTVSMLRKELSPSVPLIGFAGAPFTLSSYLIEGKPSRDFYKTKTMMYREPQLWAELMEKITAVTCEYLDLQVKAGIQAVQLFDTWAGCLSAADYDKYVLPYSKRIFAHLASSGIPRIHFGTGTSPFLESFASVDCEAVGVDWRIALAEARRRVGPKKALQGNLDPAALLAGMPFVAERVDAMFESLGDRTGYVFNLGHGLLPDAPVDVLRELVQYVHSK